MKAIFVLFDTLNRHMLPPYGCEWTHAPNFERLAKRTVTFENAYVGSMPCMPARRELHTGRYNFLHRSWGPLEPFDDSMPEILKQNGVYSHLISDHQHYWEDGGATYHTRYSSWENVRGQEGDPWKGHVTDPKIPETLSTRGEHGDPAWRQDWINRGYQQTEADQPQTQVFANGLEFIETNHQEDSWFLQIETFDPHEPFYTQQHYKDLYSHDYDGPHFDWPDYAPVNQSPEAIEHMRMEYAALLSMCDRNLGKVLDKMDELNLWDDTLLIVTTDHGFLLGEHSWWSKIRPPFYNEVAHIPLFIWDPRLKIQGERRQALAQMIDLPATLLEYFGLACPPDMQGTSLKDTVKEDTPTREAVLFGAHGGQINITDGRYLYMRAPANEKNTPLYDYTLMPTHMRTRFSVDELQNLELADPFCFTKGCKTLKIATQPWESGFNHGTKLFDLAADPGQEQPLQNPEVEIRLTEHMKRLMIWNDAPPEQFERMGLTATKTTTGFIQTNGIKIHYERTGGNKPPIVFSHGITDNGRCMLRLAEHLAARFDVILVDARGHGLSDAPENGYSANHHADDLVGLVKALGLENPIFYGHSMGARTVSRLAAKFPEIPRAVILEDPVYIIPMSQEEQDASRAWANQMPDEIRHWKTLSETELLALAKEQGHPDWKQPEEVEWARSKAQVSPNVFKIGSTMQTIADDFAQITCPVLILKADADKDIRIKNEAAIATLANGKIIHVTGAGHNVRRDNWADTLRYLESFLKEIE